MSITVLPMLRRVLELHDGGVGRIAATVKIKGSPNAPVRRRVRLFDRRSGRLLRMTWSDPVTGAYEFRNLALDRQYIVIAHDHTGLYNAVIADPITPEPMESA